VAVNNQVSLLAVVGGLALASACTSDSSGPGKLPSCGAHGTQISLAVAAYTFIDPATDSGCVTFAANTSPDTAEYLVLPWSAGGNPGSSAPFKLESATPLASISGPLFSLLPSNHGATPAAFDHFLRQVGRTRDYTRLARAAALAGGGGPQSSATNAASPPTVGSARTFKVCSNFTCSAFDNVGAVVRAVGAHIAIYVDTLAPPPGLDTASLRSLRQEFDTLLYPLDTLTFGSISDIDSNSVVVVLMTNTVNKLVSKSRCSSSGFVAGFFFSGDLDPGASTLFNNGEVFYSIVADPGATLSCSHTAAEVIDGTPVTFTHEFQHMINFVEHVRVNGGQSEDGWLDEGLSKYAEEIAGRAFLPDNSKFSQYAINAVYDGYQYMLSPEDSPLLIPADTGTLAEVGASWLFTRYIVDQFGASLPGKLVRTSLTGAANVAAQTLQPFDQTVIRWGLANWVSDLPGFSAPAELQYTSWHFRGTFSSLHSQRPAIFPLAYPLVPTLSAGNAVNVSGKLWSGTGAYVRAVQKPGAAEFTLRFSNGSGSVVSAAMVPRLNIVRIR